MVPDTTAPRGSTGVCPFETTNQMTTPRSPDATLPSLLVRRLTWGFATAAAFLLAVYASRYEGSAAHVLFSLLVASTIGAVIVLLARRVLVALVLVTALLGVVVAVSIPRLAALVVAVPIPRLAAVSITVAVEAPVVIITVAIAGLAPLAVAPRAMISIVVPVLTPDHAPAVAIIVPGLAAIVGVPISSEREADDRHVDRVDVLHERHHTVAIFVPQVVGEDPSALIVPRYVAPVVALDAAVERHAGV